MKTAWLLIAFYGTSMQPGMLISVPGLASERACIELFTTMHVAAPMHQTRLCIKYEIAR